MKYKIIIKENDEGRTLVKITKRYFESFPISLLEKLIRNKDIKLNSKRLLDKNIILSKGDIIEFYANDLKRRENNFSEYSLTKEIDIVYEDQNILIVNKPINQSMHGSDDSLNKHILCYLKFQDGSSFIPSSIGRLDKATSGLVVYAKKYSVLKQMNEKINDIEKIYIFKSTIKIQGMFNIKIQHSEIYKKEMVHFDGKSTKTKLFFKNNKKYAQIYTGRKHQIRVLLSHLGHPIIGDTKYGGIKEKRMFLHSNQITFHNLEDELKYLNNKKIIKEPI